MIRGKGGKLTSAGVYCLENGADTLLVSLGSHLRFAHLSKRGNLYIAQAMLFAVSKNIGTQLASLGDLNGNLVNQGYLVKEPRIYAGSGM